MSTNLSKGGTILKDTKENSSYKDFGKTVHDLSVNYLYYLEA